MNIPHKAAFVLIGLLVCCGDAVRSPAPGNGGANGGAPGDGAGDAAGTGGGGSGGSGGETGDAGASSGEGAEAGESGAAGEVGGDTGGGGESGSAAPDAAVDGGQPLDAGDDPPANRIFRGDLTGDGPYAVSEQSASVPALSGNLAATLYAPDDDTRGPYPLVVVLPGFLASHANYALYSRHMASWGFVVVGVNFTDAGNHPQCAQDVLDTIDWVEAEDGWGIADASCVATAGHSAGGKIAYYAASLDPSRIKAVVGWDPVNAAGPPCGVFGAPDDPDAPCNAYPVAPNPTAGQEGIMGTMTAPALTFAAPPSAFNPAEHHAQFFFQGSPSPAMYVYFVNGAHTNWGVAAAPVEEGVCKPSGVAWLLRHLQGMTGDDIDAHLPPTSSAVTVETR